MRVLFAIALAASSAACASHPVTGPAWPRTADRESDGGESLAPRAAARAIAAISEDDRVADRAADKPAAAASSAAASASASSAAETPAVSGSVSVSDEALTTEEIVIEVDE